MKNKIKSEAVLYFFTFASGANMAPYGTVTLSDNATRARRREGRGMDRKEE